MHRRRASRSAMLCPDCSRPLRARRSRASTCRSPVLVWLMIIPMLLKIDFGALGQVREHWRGVGVTLFINWAVKPFSMALLGSMFIGHLFAPWLPPAQITVLYRRPHPAGGGAMHGDGVRVVEPVRGRAALHAEPGRAERRHHGLRLRAAGRPAAGRRLDHRAVGHPADVGRALYRRAGHRRAAMAARAAAPSAGRKPCSGRCMRCSRCHWSRC